ncbi:serine hydrolase domain-containing protein [Eudoraea chungangensis]|uniref:serine hydrolase domain-containing protein n=1 Tax=Eudoraea chungangensis TaxID=1481905 RepID=UPI0023ED615F|nr:serine hydrolase domain-containing protein [Eudoraea chungangensis]
MRVNFFISLSLSATLILVSACKFETSVLPEVPPYSQGMSQPRLDKIDSMLSQTIEDEHLPGIVALIARNGKIVFHKAYGQANADSSKLMQKNSIFRIASQTKAITTTALMLLWEEGKFKLDDPIHKYIPEFKGATILDTFNDEDSTYTSIPSPKEITIRHLLTHSSGIGYGVIDRDLRFKKMYQKAGVTDLFTTKNITIEESVKKLAKLPLHQAPGEVFYYSEGLDVLGYLIEVLSEMPLDKFFKERVFDPLEMEDTFFYLPPTKEDRLVEVLHKVDDTWEKYPVTFYDQDYPISGARKFFSGGAGLSSTALDYAKFLQMYLNDGILNGKRILSRTTIKTILANQMEMWKQGGPKHYSLGFSIINQKGEDEGGQGSLGTFEWGGYFNTQYFADPEEKVIGIIMKQTQGKVEDDSAWRFRQMLFSAIID